MQQYNYNNNNINAIDTQPLPPPSPISLEKTSATTTTTTTTSSSSPSSSSQPVYNPQLVNVEVSIGNESNNRFIKLKKDKGQQFNIIFPQEINGWITPEQHSSFITEINNFKLTNKPSFIKNCIFLAIVAIVLITIGIVYHTRGNSSYSTYILFAIGGFDALLLIFSILVKIIGDKRIIKNRYREIEQKYNTPGGVIYKIKNKKTLFSQVNLVDGYSSRNEKIVILIEIPSQPLQYYGNSNNNGVVPPPTQSYPNNNNNNNYNYNGQVNLEKFQIDG